jgi:hypothetical protein
MKYFLLALVSSLFLSSCHKGIKNNSEIVRMGTRPSAIDTLKAPRSIELFLHERDTNYKRFQLRRLTQFSNARLIEDPELIKKYALKNKLNKTVFKADYDNNGYTDMLLIGEIPWPRNRPTGHIPSNLLILNYSNNTIKIIPVSFGNDSPYLIPRQIVRDGIPLINTDAFEYIYGNHEPTENFTTRILTVRDTTLIEYNANPTNYNIDKIQFATSPCYGTCSIFEIHINKEREAIFIADAYNFSHKPYAPEEKKVFKATLNTETYNKLTDLINYLDFPKLRDNYAVGWTDSPTSKLIITYNNGNVKKIEDYGLQGTFGLIKLYKYFEELRFNQKWTETTEPKAIRINTWMKGQK